MLGKKPASKRPAPSKSGKVKVVGPVPDVAAGEFDSGDENSGSEFGGDLSDGAPMGNGLGGGMVEVGGAVDIHEGRGGALDAAEAEAADQELLGGPIEPPVPEEPAAAAYPDPPAPAAGRALRAEKWGRIFSISRVYAAGIHTSWGGNCGRHLNAANGNLCGAGVRHAALSCLQVRVAVAPEIEASRLRTPALSIHGPTCPLRTASSRSSLVVFVFVA